MGVGFNFIGLLGLGFVFGDLFANSLKAVRMQVVKRPGGQLVGGLEQAHGLQLLERFGRNLSGGSKGAEIAKGAGFVCALRVELHFNCPSVKFRPTSSAGFRRLAPGASPRASRGSRAGRRGEPQKAAAFLGP